MPNKEKVVMESRKYEACTIRERSKIKTETPETSVSLNKKLEIP